MWNSKEPADSSVPSHEEYSATMRWPTFACSWSEREDQPFRLAVGSFIDQDTNQVSILQLDSKTNKLTPTATLSHSYPATKLMWFPSTSTKHDDLLLSSGDCLRVWQVNSDSSGVQLKSSFITPQASQFRGPLTSFDWTELDPEIVCTASTDSTCSLWNLRTGQFVTQIIAHDNSEVFDVAFSPTDPFVFCTVGRDGAWRRFDRREGQLQHYEDLFAWSHPLLRLSWCRTNENLVAILPEQSKSPFVFDIRNTQAPVCELDGHRGTVNAIAWSPAVPPHVCTGADDGMTHIWKVSESSSPAFSQDVHRIKPLLAYRSGGEVAHLSWSRLHPDWVAVCSEKNLRILRV